MLTTNNARLTTFINGVLLFGCTGPDSGTTETMMTDGGASSGSTSEATKTTGTSGMTSGITGTTGTTGTTSGVTSEATTLDTTTLDTTATSAGEECELEAIACEQAEAAGDFLDCGVVNPWDHSAEEWQVARQCALDAVSAEKAFKLITWLQSIDSSVGYAYVGFEGESYGVIRFFYDSYPPAIVTTQACESLSASDECIDVVGEVCLSCEAGPSSTVCGGA